MLILILNAFYRFLVEMLIMVIFFFTSNVMLLVITLHLPNDRSVFLILRQFLAGIDQFWGDISRIILFSVYLGENIKPLMQQFCVSVIKELNTKGLLLDLQVSIIENAEDSSQVFHMENNSTWSPIFN